MAGKASFADEPMTEINIVPLVDIVLVLLIIFMVTANFMDKPAIDLELPKASTAEVKQRTQFSLLLGKNGSAAIGDRKISKESAAQELAAMFNKYKTERIDAARSEGRRLTDNTARLLTTKELTMIIQADKSIPHGDIIHYIDLARKSGIYKYAFNVDPEG